MASESLFTLHTSRDTLHAPPGDARTKTTYYAKQTQFQKSPNERNCCCNKGLWQLGHLVAWEKQSQYKPNTNPIQTQFKPNTKPKQTQTNPIQTQTNPISKAKKSRNEIIFEYFQTFPQSAQKCVFCFSRRR